MKEFINKSFKQLLVNGFKPQLALGSWKKRRVLRWRLLDAESKLPGSLAISIWISQIAELNFCKIIKKTAKKINNRHNYAAKVSSNFRKYETDAEKNVGCVWNTAARLTVVLKERLLDFNGVVFHVVGKFEYTLAAQSARVELQTDQRKYRQNENGQDRNVSQASHGFQ